MKDDEFVFALIDKRLKSTRYPEKLTICGRLNGLPMRKVLIMCDEGDIPCKVWPPHPKMLASVAALIERPEVEGQISVSNLRRGRSFRKKELVESFVRNVYPTV